MAQLSWQPLLLAWLHAAGSRTTALARHLLEHAPLGALPTADWGHALRAALIAAPPPTPAPEANSHRTAAAQLRAIATLGLTLRPIWSLPASLTQLSPPVALFVRGHAPLLDVAQARSIVGSRACGAAGLAWAEAHALAAVQRGELVVSGGARCIDAAAHRGALRAGRPTLAYIGVAADRIYPAEHRELFAAMLSCGGALVSEHPPGARTERAAHAQRNRFIAAHGQALVVVEAACASGTLRTVQAALRLGRPVLVPPPTVGGERAGLEALLAAGRASIVSPTL